MPHGRAVTWEFIITAPWDDPFTQRKTRSRCCWTSAGDSIRTSREGNDWFYTPCFFVKLKGYGTTRSPQLYLIIYPTFHDCTLNSRKLFFLQFLIEFLIRLGSFYKTTSWKTDTLLFVKKSPATWTPLQTHVFPVAFPIFSVVSKHRKSSPKLTNEQFFS